MKKLRNFHSYPTVYCMRNSDMRFENNDKNIIRNCISTRKGAKTQFTIFKTTPNL